MKKLRLNTIKNTRLSLASILREMHAGVIDDQHGKALAHCFNIYLTAWRLETETEIEKRLSELEAKIGGTA